MESIPNLENLSAEELKHLRTKIAKNCDHWKSCRDGSYEAALHHEGYYAVDDELSKRRGVQG